MQKFKTVIDKKQLIVLVVFSLGSNRKSPNMSDVKSVKANNVSTPIAGVDFKCFFTFSIREGNETLAVVEPLCEAVPSSTTLAVLKNRSLPICHREGFPSNRECQGLPVWGRSIIL